MEYAPREIRRLLLRLRAEMLIHLGRTERDTFSCERCLLPFPEGEYEAYSFCPWCSMSSNGSIPRCNESRKIIENAWGEQDEIQCGECGGEYEQPTRYPFRFCPDCGAPFAAEDEFLIVLPFRV